MQSPKESTEGTRWLFVCFPAECLADHVMCQDAGDIAKEEEAKVAELTTTRKAMPVNDARE